MHYNSLQVVYLHEGGWEKVAVVVIYIAPILKQISFDSRGNVARNTYLSCAVQQLAWIMRIPEEFTYLWRVVMSGYHFCRVEEIYGFQT